MFWVSFLALGRKWVSRVLLFSGVFKYLGLLEVGFLEVVLKLQASHVYLHTYIAIFAAA